MSQYRAVDAVVEAAPALQGDRPALVVTGDGRMALERGDVSWASWAAMAAAKPGDRVNILVRK